jgi:hypothetical protein
MYVPAVRITEAEADAIWKEVKEKYPNDGNDMWYLGGYLTALCGQSRFLWNAGTAWDRVWSMGYDDAEGDLDDE